MVVGGKGERCRHNVEVDVRTVTAPLGEAVTVACEILAVPLYVLYQEVLKYVFVGVLLLLLLL